MVHNKTRRNKSRRSKTHGGSNCGMKTESMPATATVSAPVMGGKRRNKTRSGKRKMSKGASDWNKKVMGVYAEMKKKNANASFRDALVESSKRKKAGTL